jgi:hypothetical protein
MKSVKEMSFSEIVQFCYDNQGILYPVEVSLEEIATISENQLREAAIKIENYLTFDERLNEIKARVNKLL